MSDKSGGGKSKINEKSERQSAKSSSSSESSKTSVGSGDNGTVEAPSDRSEKASVSATSSTSDGKSRMYERREYSRPHSRGSPTVRNGNFRGRRDDTRKYNNLKTKKTESKLSQGSTFSTSMVSQRDSQSSYGDRKQGYNDPAKQFGDDTKLSKLMRRVLRDSDPDRRVSAARQLKDFLQSPEGTKGAVKSFDDILSALLSVLYEKTYRDVKHEVSTCIGVVGSTPGIDSAGYYQWVCNHVNSVADDDLKVHFVNALLESLKYCEKRQTPMEHLPMLMERVQNMIENADTPEFLTAVIDVVLHIVKTQPHIFQPHFRNTVDILVGWHIDPMQKESLLSYVSDALVSFQPFWTTDITFSATLLGQFLEDMEAYAEDLTSSLGGHGGAAAAAEEEKRVAEELKEFNHKLAALLRVFTTVVQSLGDSLAPAKGQISQDYICQIVQKIVRNIDAASKIIYSELVMMAANGCLSLLLGHLVGSKEPRCQQLLPYIVEQCYGTSTCSKPLLASILTLIQKAVEAFGTQLPVSFLTEILGPGSKLHTGKLLHSGEMLTQLISVYHCIMGLKNVPLLEEAYRMILGDIEVAFNTLLRGSPTSTPISLVPDNPFADMAYHPKQAEDIIVFDVCALAEIATSKSNLIGTWALTPNVFDLLSCVLLPLDEHLADHHSCVQYAVLQALYSHCGRHGHFISSSVLLGPPLEACGMAALSQATSTYLSHSLALLQRLLNNPSTSYDCRCLGVKWVSDIISSLQTSPHVFVTKEFSSLIQTLVNQGYHHEQQIFLASCQCLSNLLKLTTLLPDKVIKLTLDLCVFRLSDNRKAVREAFSGLLKLLPLDCITRAQLFEVEEEALAGPRQHRLLGLKASWLARRSHMARTPLGTCVSHNFRHIMAFLLHGTPPSQFGIFHWLEAMFHASQRGKRDADGVSLAELVDGNESLLWFWATWEAAEFCVLLRLRTPLGKPQDTFMSIEGVLKSFASELHGLTDSGGHGHGHGESSRSEAAGSLGWTASVQRRGGLLTRSQKAGEYTSLLRVHLLLQFMEHLEKLLYNAYEGCAVAIATPPKAVRSFFRTNRNTCQEWLSRIRLCMITVASHAGLHAMVVRQAFEYLSELNEQELNQGQDVEQVVVMLVKALTELNSPETVLGLYCWCKEATGHKFHWLRAAAEKASYRYENAGQQYMAIVREALGVVGDKEEEEAKSDSSPEGSPRLSAERRHGTPKHEPLPATINFIVNEVTDCYAKVQDWQGALQWQETLQHYRSSAPSPLARALQSASDLNYIKALSEFDLGNLSGVQESLELVPGASVTDFGRERDSNVLPSWSPALEVDNVHRQFIRAATLMQEQKPANHRNEVHRCLSQAEKMAEGILRLRFLDWPPMHYGQVMAELDSVACLRRQMEDKKSKTLLVPLSERLKLESETQELPVFLQALRLINTQLQLPGYNRKPDLTNQLCRLQLEVAALARKQHNFRLAETLLLRQAATLCQGQQAHSDNGRLKTGKGLLPALTALGDPGSGVGILDMVRVEREGAKLLRSQGQQREALEVLSSGLLALLSQDAQQDEKLRPGSEGGELCARSLLSLVKWLQGDSKLLSSLTSQVRQAGQGDAALSSPSSLSSCLAHFLEAEEDGANRSLGIALDPGEQGLHIGDNPILSESESVVGRLLHLSTMEAPRLSKAWFTLAGWCYKWGRKAVDNASHGSVELSPEERSQIVSLLPKGVTGEEREKVLGVLSQVHSPVSSEEDISDQDQSLYDDGTETTKRQLLSCSTALQHAPDSCIEQLLNVWRGVVRRVYHYYQLSARSYFTFLQLDGEEDCKSSEDRNIISTLRLLRLLVKHAWELRGVLEGSLARTPTAPWKGIIPQLFSRLNHPEGYVRQSVSELLCRVAQDAPHLIIYPAVVGSSATKMESKVSDQSGLLMDYLSQHDDEALDGEEQQSPPVEEESPADDPNVTILQSCLASIVDTLSHHNPKMIAEVQQMVQELRRITLLWDELWLGTLNQQHQDVARRMMQLENEVKKVNNNSALSRLEKAAIIREKHRTIMKPTLYTMERLHEITSQPPETPHEKWFQDTYSRLIQNALDRLREPSNPSHPHASWHLFKQLHINLQQRAAKRNSLHLKMEEISPRLAGLASSVIPMPGLGVKEQAITIASVCSAAQILPTKTKPKKLVLIGSDGRRYPYLFKGLEDLHLDERIMQFLSIVNNMLNSADKDNRQLYRARHYSVTPLGPRSGLIQWVEGATPLFSLYKKWQQREAISQTFKSPSSHNATVNPPPIPRPSEVFYSKLTPLLKEKGIDTLDNRKEWPLSILKKVMEDLMDETPDDLLARELLCSSLGASEWWMMTQAYARSTAVMSMIGYIIGLGDRHLDNVLVDLATGEVVHIDYNVCFEKGKYLRVPERVPFRMTQNIETALGVTGVEGTFRIASEHVMRTMRKGRETLLTLLEAFVYDPLVDWTTGNEGGYTGAFYGGGGAAGLAQGPDTRQSKKDMEREISLSMFAIRVAEMKAAWTKNKEELVAAMPELIAEVQAAASAMGNIQVAMGNQESLKAQRSLLQDALSNPQHSIFTLPSRYADYAVIKHAKDEAQKAVEDRIAEYQSWQAVHKKALETLRGPTFQKMCALVREAGLPSLDSFHTASDFLQGAGQGHMVEQGEQLEEELQEDLQQLHSLMHIQMQLLHTYNTMVSQFGLEYASTCRTHQHLTWLKELLHDFTSDTCNDTLALFNNMYGTPPHAMSAKYMAISSTENRLKAIINDLNTKLVKLMERRSQEGPDLAALEAPYLEAERAVACYAQANGSSEINSLILVIIHLLTNLNRRYVTMEAAATGAEDRLLALTSREGDWFLEELSSISANIVLMLETLKKNTMAGDIANYVELHLALTCTHNVYVALQDLNVHFRTIILPEAVKLIQSQEPSMMAVLSRLETLVRESPFSLESLVNQLELQHRNLIIGLQSDAGSLLQEVGKLEAGMLRLLGDASLQAELSQGEKLLTGFSGLFSRLDDQFARVMDAMENIGVPDTWRKVDVIREARAMQLSPFTEETQTLLKAQFVLKRLQAMQEFFHMATQCAGALQGIDGGQVFDDEQMSKPVKKFIADFVRKQLIGFPSQILGYIVCVLCDYMGLNVSAAIEVRDVGAESKLRVEELSRKVQELCRAGNQVTPSQMTHAGTLTSTLDATWRKLDLIRRLDTNVQLLKSSLERSQPQLARFQWLHEDVFTQASRSHTTFDPPVRSHVMSELKKGTQSLVNQEALLTHCHDQYLQLEAQVMQRLRWASGANPLLLLMQQQLEEKIALRKRFYEEESKQVHEVVTLCQTVLHFEAARTRTAEAMASDANFVTILNRCKECCFMMETSESSVGDLELQLLELKRLPPSQPLDKEWLQTTLTLVNQNLTESGQNLAQLSADLDTHKSRIQDKASGIRFILASHHTLMSEIRTILKNMAKQEEYDYGEVVVPGGIREFVLLYKKFSENMSAGLKAVVGEEASQQELEQTGRLLQEVAQEVPLIYDSVVRFAPPLLPQNGENEEGQQPDLSRVLRKAAAEREMASPMRKLNRDLQTGTPPNSPQTSAVQRAQGAPAGAKREKISRDPRTGKALQERNSYAVGVWRKVKFKLDGRDPDSSKRLTVQEQVEHVIKEATLLDNLAMLYEGWTPWV